MKSGRFNKVLLSFFVVIFCFSFLSVTVAQADPVTAPGATGPTGTSSPTGTSPSKPVEGMGESGDVDCGRLDVGCAIRTAIGTAAVGVLQFGGNTVLSGFGQLFDSSIAYTVTKSMISSPGFQAMIYELWKVFRDIGNIVIIFSLLYLAIKTILQGNGFADTKVMAGILIAALFINFSLFFTKIAFDVSNWTGVAIYNQIVGPGSEYQGATISEGVMRILNLSSLIGDLSNAGQGEWGDLWSNLGHAVLMLILFLILATIFFFAGIFLLFRFFIFVILMITSPFGLVARFIPWMEGVGKKWWDELKKQVIVLPVFFITLFVGLYATGILFAQNTGLSVSSPAGLAEYLVSFILAIVFLGLALFVPGYVGAAGSGIMSSAGNKLRGYGMGAIDWAKKRPAWAKQAAIDGAKSTGRYGFGALSGGVAKMGQKYVGGKARATLEDKELKRKALMGGKEGEAAMRKLEKAKKASERTYDFRNIKVGGKTLGERGMGEGIKKYEDRKKEAMKELEDKKKAQMELTGAKDIKGKPEDIMEARQNLKEHESRKREMMKEYAQLVKNGDTEGAKQKAKDVSELEENEIKSTRNALAQLQNLGEHQANQLMTSRAEKMGGIMKEAAQKIVKDSEKKWKVEKSDKNQKELLDALKNVGKDK